MIIRFSICQKWTFLLKPVSCYLVHTRHMEAMEAAADVTSEGAGGGVLLISSICKINRKHLINIIILTGYAVCIWWFIYRVPELNRASAGARAARGLRTPPRRTRPATPRTSTSGATTLPPCNNPKQYHLHTKLLAWYRHVWAAAGIPISFILRLVYVQ